VPICACGIGAFPESICNGRLKNKNQQRGERESNREKRSEKKGGGPKKERGLKMFMVHPQSVREGTWPFIGEKSLKNKKKRSP